MTRRTVAARVAAKSPIIAHTEQPQLSLLLSEKEAAKFSGVSVAYLRRGRSQGTTGRRTPTPPFVRVEGRVFYRRADLAAWASALPAREVI
jgi:hypothetical protein